MAESTGEQQPGADPSESTGLPAEPTTTSDVEQPAANAVEAQAETVDRDTADDPSPGCAHDTLSEPDLDESFDRGGLVVIAAIFLLIGLAVAVEFLWR